MDRVAEAEPEAVDTKDPTITQLFQLFDKRDRIGLQQWPDVPRSIEWKKGVCQHLGWPHRDQADIARAWQHILSRVHSYDDLEPALLGRVEELIDFTTSSD